MNKKERIEKIRLAAENYCKAYADERDKGKRDRLADKFRKEVASLMTKDVCLAMAENSSLACQRPGAHCRRDCLVPLIGWFAEKINAKTRKPN